MAGLLLSSQPIPLCLVQESNTLAYGQQISKNQRIAPHAEALNLPKASGFVELVAVFYSALLHLKRALGQRLKSYRGLTQAKLSYA
jgi:hypothetical protein